MGKSVQPRQPTREGQSLKREDDRIREKSDSVILEGRLTDSVRINNGTTAQIKHGLGRKPNGYIFTRYRAAGAISDPLREVKMDEHLIELRNDSAVTIEVALWVF